MSLASLATGLADRVDLPDGLLRLGISQLVGRTHRAIATATPAETARFAQEMRNHPIAVHTDASNAQHYRIEPAFFVLTLGARLKYSSCLYPRGDETLDQAEVAALERTVAQADLRDGQDILELGCGWGSLSLFMAERFPNARITVVSHSSSQRGYIEAELARRGLGNVTVITDDMNDFQTMQRFDRVISVEMFEHMSNWHALLSRIRGWLRPDGYLYIHIFTHRAAPYRFDHHDQADWIAQHFFTGGVMPSHDLPRHFPDLFTVERDWRWSGTHYQRTADHWLERFDANLDRIQPVLRQVYGDAAATWRRRWRIFFMATAGLFGHANGDAWGVSHYLMRPVP